MSESDQVEQNGATAVQPAKSPEKSPTRPRDLPLFNVVLLDDNDHTAEYVLEMLRVLFGYPPEKGYDMVKEVDETGRVIVLTTHKEHAELKRDQIHAYGADHRVATCAGSMSAIVEPAECC